MWCQFYYYPMHSISLAVSLLKLYLVLNIYKILSEGEIKLSDYQ
jgi:hypothetical protein